MEPYWDLIARIINGSDLVLEILDARFVELSRNEEVERLVKEIGRPLIFVVNKSDLISRNGLEKQISGLKNYGEVVFISSKNKKSTKILLYAIKKVFKKYGKREILENKIKGRKISYREAKAEIVVGVLGYPNVGKSSVINALAHKKKVKVSKKAGTTHGIHWVKASNEIKLIDSPGVIPLSKDDEVRYGLIGAKDVEKLKNLEIVVNAIINLFIKSNKNSFEKFYDIKIISANPEEIVNSISEKKRHLLKGGNPDKHRTCSMIIRDWQQGKLRL